MKKYAIIGSLICIVVFLALGVYTLGGMLVAIVFGSIMGIVFYSTKAGFRINKRRNTIYTSSSKLTPEMVYQNLRNKLGDQVVELTLKDNKICILTKKCEYTVEIQGENQYKIKEYIRPMMGILTKFMFIGMPKIILDNESQKIIPNITANI